MIIMFKFNKLRKIAMIILSIALFFNFIFVFLFFIQYSEFKKKVFVVISNSANIYLTPNDDDNILFSVTEGTKGIVRDEIGDSVKINLSDGTSGWIKKNKIVTADN